MHKLYDILLNRLFRKNSITEMFFYINKKQIISLGKTRTVDLIIKHKCMTKYINLNKIFFILWIYNNRFWIVLFLYGFYFQINFFLNFFYYLLSKIAFCFLMHPVFGSVLYYVVIVFVLAFISLIKMSSWWLKYCMVERFSFITWPEVGHACWRKSRKSTARTPPSIRVYYVREIHPCPVKIGF